MAERRAIRRDSHAFLAAPLSAILTLENDNILDLEIINFDFRGAAFSIGSKANPILHELVLLAFTTENRPPPRIDIRLAGKTICENLPYRLAWESLKTSGHFGVEFLQSLKSQLMRNIRYPCHAKAPSTVEFRDPLDPNRSLYGKVENYSAAGLLVETSLSNKHLFPGMVLGDCVLSIPGSSPIKISLRIQNTRLNSDGSRLHLGLSTTQNRTDFVKIFENYRKRYPTLIWNDDSPVRHLTPKHLKSALTFRIISDPDQYEEVLRLRFAGYKHAGKVQAGKTWQDMGEGLASEGEIHAAYIDGQLIASFELRIGGKHSFRYLEPETLKHTLPTFRADRTVEVNKLVIAPKAQGTDAVIGLIQKIHGIVLAKGGLDIAMACTAKLVPLYRRAGAIDTGLKVPHPALENVELHVMFGHHETYQGRGHLDPFAWSFIYSQVELLFRGAEPRSKRLYTQYVRPSLSWIRRRIASPIHDTARGSVAETVAEGFIDPKWTHQDFIATLLLPYVLEADHQIGKSRVDEILKEMGVTRSYIRSRGNWLSVTFLDAFLEHLEPSVDLNILSASAGRRALDKENIGALHFALKHISLERTLASIPDILKRFNKSRIAKIRELRPGYACIEIGTTDQHRLPKHRASCQNFLAHFDEYVRIKTGRHGDVRETLCSYDGHSHCRYEIRWTEPPPDWTLRLALTATTALATFGIASITLSTSTAALTSFLFAAAVSLVYALRDKKALRNDLVSLQKTHESFQSESDERFRVLQETKEKLDLRYREAMMLEKASRDIQSSSGFASILDGCLQNACELLNIKRAVVLLRDESAKSLRPAAIRGLEKEAAGTLNSIWNFSVDVSRPRNTPVVISSVYRSSTPVIVDDVKQHLFQLNKSSQHLIASLGMTGFAIVPIPGSDKNWGVILIDTTGRKDPISTNDIVLLQRVAQQLGLSLDAEARLEKEKQLRTLFQKYVPTSVLNIGDETNKVRLGGTLRTVISAFVDVRGFTTLSNKLPAFKVLDILNRFFAVLQEEVSKHGGILEKFLGDGALITWGHAGYQSDLPTSAVTAGVSILTRLPKLNSELTAQGLPPLEIGIGISIGEAIVGNIGTNDRLEFTCIGPSVNFASRLESLCKSLHSNMIISTELRQLLDPELQSHFRLTAPLEIRGFANPVTVAVFERKEHEDECAS